MVEGTPTIAVPRLRRRTGLAVLALATVLCLVPFAGKAFHVDDPLFVWTAQRITEAPLDPYGFEVNWSLATQPMYDVTKNPPLASYYLALAGSLAGWSELSLHVAMLLPALLVVAGTFRLAARLGADPLVAGFAALLTPAFVVSATGVMSDVTMLALWIWAVVLWVEGLDRERAGRLVGAAALVSAAALAKYFAVALLPLLVAYASARRARPALWAPPLLLPVLVLAAYQVGTDAVYGRGLLSDAAGFAADWKSRHGASLPARALTGLAFVGGGALTAVTLAPLVWSRRVLAAGGLLAAAAALAGAGLLARGTLADQGPLIGAHAGVLVAGGVAVVALALDDLRRRRDADSLLLALWVGGTFLFASFVNWTTNGRSVLPLVPAVAILLARRLPAAPRRAWTPGVVAGLVLAGIVSLWVACADWRLAGSQREAASTIAARAAAEHRQVWFHGHWGFQYYLEAAGGSAIDVRRARPREGDLIVLPWNNTRVIEVPAERIRARETLSLPGRPWVATLHKRRGAGFYASGFGPLPFVFGPVPPERYELLVFRAGP